MRANNTAQTIINQAEYYDQIIFDLYKTNRKAFELIISGVRKYKKYFPAYETMATLVGIGRRQMMRIIKKLKEVGLIWVLSRGRTRSNEYQIARHLFKAFLKRFTIAEKLAASRSRLQNVTLLNDIYIKNINNNVTVDKEHTKREGEECEKGDRTEKELSLLQRWELNKGKAREFLGKLGRNE